jgi:tetratricopeptide (TPR) repeat protein
LLLLTDELDEARREAEAALELDGMSTFWLDTIGYLLSLSGDWERGPEILRQALEINPFPRRACHGALWLDALRQGDPAAALSAAREYAPEVYFWSPLMEAVALVANQQPDEAAAAAGRLLQIKPDFSDHGHWLITRYVKPPKLVETIERSLAEAGVSVHGG